MIAIATKYLGPTNTRGSRIKAYRMDDPGVSVTVPYRHELNMRECHHSALLAFLDSPHGDLLPLTVWQCGSTEDGYVWVWVEGSEDIRATK